MKMSCQNAVFQYRDEQPILSTSTNPCITRAAGTQRVNCIIWHCIPVNPTSCTHKVGSDKINSQKERQSESNKCGSLLEYELNLEKSAHIAIIQKTDAHSVMLVMWGNI
jgi:hypothetical protein